MEQDLERSEEKNELSERFVLAWLHPVFFCFVWNDFVRWAKIFTKISTHYTFLLISNFFLVLENSKIVELEEELRVVGNNLKSLEVSEEKVIFAYFQIDRWNHDYDMNPIWEYSYWINFVLFEIFWNIIQSLLLNLLFINDRYKIYMT